jgi:hypothetical protein
VSNRGLHGIPPADPPLPDRATLWADEFVSLSGAALVTSVNTGQRYSHYVSRAVGVDGDAMEQSFVLRAGRSLLSVLGFTTNGNGKVDWYLDGALVVAGQDWYSAVTAFNVIQTATIVVGSNGLHTLRAVVNGKHASSSSYVFPLTKLWLR